MTVEYKTTEYKETFTFDAEKRELYFAGKTFQKLKFLKSASDATAIMGIAGSSKIVNKNFTELYGITPSVFKRVFNAIMYNLHITPIKKHVLRYAFMRGGRLNSKAVNQIWAAKDKIEQCEKDGIENIIPFVIKTNKAPEELKQMYGKGLWKKVCKQSMTRNRYIADLTDLRYARLAANVVSIAVQLPSHALKKKFYPEPSTLWLHMIGQLKGQARPDGPCRRTQQLFIDTRSMAEQLGKGFSDTWSYDKMNQKHEEYTRLLMLKKYSPLPFEHLKDFKVKSMEYNGYVATLLDSPLSIYEEGQAMHHCVGMYTKSVEQKNYLVYSVTKKQEDGSIVRNSTIGIHIWKYDEDYQVTKRVDGVWVSEKPAVLPSPHALQQQYGLCNAYVTDSDELKLTDMLIKELNK